MSNSSEGTTQVSSFLDSSSLRFLHKFFSGCEPVQLLKKNTADLFFKFPDPKGIAFGIKGIGEVASWYMRFWAGHCSPIFGDFF